MGFGKDMLKSAINGIWIVFEMVCSGRSRESGEVRVASRCVCIGGFVCAETW